jgi:hypothetical protein
MRGVAPTPAKFPWHCSGSVDRFRNWRPLRWRNCLMDGTRCAGGHRIGGGTHADAAKSRGTRQALRNRVHGAAASAATRAPVRGFRTKDGRDYSRKPRGRDSEIRAGCKFPGAAAVSASPDRRPTRPCARREQWRAGRHGIKESAG